MSRLLHRRIEVLEEQGRADTPATSQAIMAAAKTLRAGGSMPEDWARLWGPSQVLRMADECRRAAENQAGFFN